MMDRETLWWVRVSTVLVATALIVSVWTLVQFVQSVQARNDAVTALVLEVRGSTEGIACILSVLPEDRTAGTIEACLGRG